MLVHVLADTSDKLFGLCSVLERQFTVAGERLDVAARLPQAPAAVVIRVDLRSIENIAALKMRAARLAKAHKRIFLVEQVYHVCISQAYALGATLVLPGKIDPNKLMAALADPAGSEASSTCDISQPNDAVDAAATAIASMFTSVALGERIDIDGTKEAGRMITNRISAHGSGL